MKLIDLDDKETTYYFHDLHFYNKDLSIDRVVTWLDDEIDDGTKEAREKWDIAQKYPDEEFQFELKVTPKTARQLKNLRKKAQILNKGKTGGKKRPKKT